MEWSDIWITIVKVFAAIFSPFSKAAAAIRNLRHKDKSVQRKQFSNFIFQAHTAKLTTLEEVFHRYITVVQHTKDSLRSYIHLSECMSKSKRLAILHELREKLTDCYSSSRAYFDSTPYGGHAHIVKSGLLNVILKLESGQPYDPIDLLDAINLISSDQQHFTQGMRHAVTQLQYTLQQTHS